MKTLKTLFLIFALAFTAIAQEQPAQPAQTPACPEALPGSEVTITIAWEGITVPIKMPASANTILNKFAAELCDQHGKDTTGIITGTKDAPLPQNLWSINLIIKTYVSLVENIIARDPSKYLTGQAKTLTEEAAAKTAEAKAAAEKAAKEALQVQPTP